jgi:hypothetical protein
MPLKDGNTLLRCVISQEDFDLLTSLHTSGRANKGLQKALDIVRAHHTPSANKTVLKARAVRKKLREQLMTLADTVNELGEDE